MCTLIYLAKYTMVIKHLGCQGCPYHTAFGLGSVQVLYKHVGGGGLKEMLILLMWLGGRGESRGKMLILLM